MAHQEYYYILTLDLSVREMDERKLIRLEWHATQRELNLGVQHVDRQERYFRT